MFYLEPGPVPGMSTRLLGPGDQARRAAARAQPRHGRPHQRRVAVSSASTPRTRRLPVDVIQEPLTQDPDPHPDARHQAAQPAARRRPAACQAHRDVKDTREAIARSRPSSARRWRAPARHADGVTARARSTCCATAGCCRRGELVGVRGAGKAFDGLYFVQQRHAHAQARRVQAGVRAGAQRPRLTLPAVPV